MYCSFQLPESTGFVPLCEHRYAFSAANRRETDSGCLRKADLTMQDESGETVLHPVAMRWHEAVEDVDKDGVGGVEVGDLYEEVGWPSENRGPQR